MRTFMATLVVVVLVAAVGRTEGEEKVPLDKLPKAVVDAVKVKFPKAELVEAEKEELGGKTYFEVKIKNAGKTLEVKLTAEGKIEAVEDDDDDDDGEEKVALDKLPKVILDGVKAKFPNAQLVEAAREKEDGQPVYEVTIKDGGTTIDVTLTPDGKIFMVEKEITARDLPKAVADAIEARYPKATFRKVEMISKDDKPIAYEALLETADKQRVEAKFDPQGKLLEEEKKGAAKKDDKKNDR
jgi:uncharacterized membrane protein YkoI